MPLPDRFDLLLISYISATEDRMNMKWFAFAPCFNIQVGDTVETAFGRAFVLEKAICVSKDDSIISMMNGTVAFDRVLFKLDPMRYEDVEDS